jgi:hypothetical protein
MSDNKTNSNSLQQSFPSVYTQILNQSIPEDENLPISIQATHDGL